MTKKGIKIILLNKDLTVAALARRIGHSRTWTSQVLYGHEKSLSARKAISTALGLSPWDLWGEGSKKVARNARAAKNRREAM